MNLQRYAGCNLEVAEVFDTQNNTDERSRLSERIRSAQREGVATYTRRTNISIPYEHPYFMKLTVDDLVNTADSLMTQLAASIGATVVKHDWCLIPKKLHSVSQLARLGIHHFDLGAHVEIITGTKLQPETHQNYLNLHRTLTDTSGHFYDNNGYQILDITLPSQYVEVPHSSKTQNSRGTSLVLVDIEPRFVDYKI
jgi:hypothetical protein